MNPNTELHWSQLKHVLDCPAQYRYALDHPIVPTDAMIEGTAFDLLVMPRSMPRVVNWDGGRRYGKKWDSFVADNDDAIILPTPAYNRVRRMADAFLSDPHAQEVMAGGAHQRFMRWQLGKRDCAGTPDVCGEILADVKRTDADPRVFYRHADKMLWDGQLAWYEAGMQAAGLSQPKRLCIVACSPKPPHHVTVFDLSELRIEEGHRKWGAAFETLLRCEENDHWPGYAERPVLWRSWDEEV